jgi:hypothetical protein
MGKSVFVPPGLRMLLFRSKYQDYLLLDRSGNDSADAESLRHRKETRNFPKDTMTINYTKKVSQVQFSAAQRRREVWEFSSVQRRGEEKLVSSVHRIIRPCSVTQRSPLLSNLASESE